MGDSFMNPNTEDNDNGSKNDDPDNLVGLEGGNIDIQTTKKISVLNQLQPSIREELSSHIWEIISYNPPRFLVAHSGYKQVIFATLKEEKIRRINNGDSNTIESGISETISSLNLSRIVIGAIPVEVTLNRNPLWLFEHKYTIRFITQSNDSFTIGPKTLDEMITYLKDRSLIFMSAKSTEALAIIIGAFERNGQLIIKNEVDTPGFYFVDGKIKNYHKSHKKPTYDQIIKCCELLNILQTKFKSKDIFPTIIKWSIVAPFDYILKQIHKKWIPWLHLYGWSNTGKTTLGDISSCVWNRYQDKDSILSFTAADTKARFGEVLSKSTYPVVINEVGQLSDDRYRDLVEMFKTAITDTVARKKFVNKTIYIDIPSFSPCILTGNPTPPYDTGYRRRTITIIFTEKDQYSSEEIEEFKKLFNERIKTELRILGDFTVNYILENQSLLLDGEKDWKELAEIILSEMYKSAGRVPPEWIKYFVKENQLEESREDNDLLFRSFLINKINEIYYKYYKSLEKMDAPNLPFSHRLNFCLENKLIPFLNSTNVGDNDRERRTLILITSDLISELRNKIPNISSLNEVSRIIDGFQYGQKKVGGKNVRTAYGTNIQLLDFLGMD